MSWHTRERCLGAAHALTWACIALVLMGVHWATGAAVLLRALVGVCVPLAMVLWLRYGVGVWAPPRPIAHATARALRAVLDFKPQLSRRGGGPLGWLPCAARRRWNYSHITGAWGEVHECVRVRVCLYVCGSPCPGVLLMHSRCLQRYPAHYDDSRHAGRRAPRRLVHRWHNAAGPRGRRRAPRSWRAGGAVAAGTHAPRVHVAVAALPRSRR
jgi:hypothetical protein